MSSSINQSKQSKIHSVFGVEDLSSDTTASIQGGAALTIYKDIDLKGSWLGSFDTGGRSEVSVNGQEMSSVNIKSGTWAFYDGTNFTGEYVTLGRGVHNFTDYGLNDRVDSFRRIG